MVEELTKLGTLKRLHKELEDELDQGWRPHWLELSQYISPGSGLYLRGNHQDVNRGEKRQSYILNDVSENSNRVMAAGLHGGLTSPTRPWIRFTFSKQELMVSQRAQEWLTVARDVILQIFSKSNFYGSIHTLYEELGPFATSAMFLEEDFETIIRCRPLTIGEFVLSLNDKYRPDTIYRRISMTVRQIVLTFGIDNVNDKIRRAYEDTRQWQQRHPVIHVARPREFFDPGKADSRNMPYESLYWMDKASDNEGFLRESGYQSIPFVAPRWQVYGVDTYGRGPGMQSLPDIKQLQRIEKDKLKALAKIVDPPMRASGDVRPAGGNVLPGGITFTSGTQDKEGWTPAYQIDLRLAEVSAETTRVETRIQRAFFNDLFLAIIQQSKSMTATEVASRYEEKMLMLGPTLERLQTELFTPIIDRTFEIALRFGAIPPPPEELRGEDLQVEYIGLLAQAQKLVGVTAVEQTLGFVTALAGAYPEAVDKINPDEAIAVYSDMVGVPPRMLRADDEVEEIRRKRAEQEQAAAMLEQASNAKAAAEAVKIASEIPGEAEGADVLAPGLV